MKALLNRIQQVFFVTSLASSVGKKTFVERYALKFCLVLMLSIIGGIVLSALLLIALNSLYILMLSNDVSGNIAYSIVIALCAVIAVAVYFRIKTWVLAISKQSHSPVPDITRIVQEFYDGLMKQ